MAEAFEVVPDLVFAVFEGLAVVVGEEIDDAFELAGEGVDASSDGLELDVEGGSFFGVEAGVHDR